MAVFVEFEGRKQGHVIEIIVFPTPSRKRVEIKRFYFSAFVGKLPFSVHQIASADTPATADARGIDNRPNAVQVAAMRLLCAKVLENSLYYPSVGGGDLTI